jgi:pimeloyl-ACP methyl ester carboxylesterase
MKVLRTPEERFKNLPGYPFEPNFIEDLQGYENLRMHYVDEGSKESDIVFLCLHGEPSWSYLYRKMIPIFVEAGYRAVAPDLFGFGKSDKLVEDDNYSFKFHRNAVLSFIKYLDLKNIALVCQDWGGILGLTLPMEMPDRFTRLLIMNTFLPASESELPSGFLKWVKYNNSQPDLAIGAGLAHSLPLLSEEEIAAYDAPFPDITYKAAVRTFPNIVWETFQTSKKAQEFLTKDWSGDTFMAIGLKDFYIGGPPMHYLRKFIKNCPQPFELEEGDHFLQEWGDIIAKEALKSFGLI